MDLNINHPVRVKLTDTGRKAHAKDHIERWTAWGMGVPVPAYVPPVEDADGWSKWQLWALMADFGNHMGPGRDVPFETTIQIIESDSA